MNTKISLIPGSWLVDNHVDYPDTLFNNLLALDYDKSMRARWTASFGKSYDYSGKTYPYAPMPDFLDGIYDRMKNVHNENENYDYMIKFREIIDDLKN